MDYCKELYNLLSDVSIQKWTLSLTFLSTILWGIYVFYTRKTFLEIKKQTDIQYRAILIAKPSICDKLDFEKLHKTSQDAHAKWKNILTNNLPPEAISKEEHIILQLINRGKSDINYWSIKFTFVIHSTEFLEKKRNTVGETIRWEINSLSNDLIPPGEHLDVPVMQIGHYPKGFLTWEIIYHDINDEIYSRSSNGIGFEVSNKIAFEYKG